MYRGRQEEWHVFKAASTKRAPIRASPLPYAAVRLRDRGSASPEGKRALVIPRPWRRDAPLDVLGLDGSRFHKWVEGEGSATPGRASPVGDNVTGRALCIPGHPRNPPHFLNLPPIKPEHVHRDRDERMCGKEVHCQGVEGALARGLHTGPADAAFPIPLQRWRRKPGPAPPTRKSFLGLSRMSAPGCSVSREPLLGGRAMGLSIARGLPGIRQVVGREVSLRQSSGGARSRSCGVWGSTRPLWKFAGESHRSHFRPAA